VDKLRRRKGVVNNINEKYEYYKLPPGVGALYICIACEDM
jgi:hypothetical protein